MLRLCVSVALLSCLISTSAAMICKQTINNVTYDLSPLSGVDTAVIPSGGNYNYYISVCGAVQNSGCSANGAAFVCQVRKYPVNQFESVMAYSDDSHTPPPEWSPSSIDKTAGVKLTFTNGDTCNLRTRTTVIDFYCDPTGQNTTTVVESPQCTFNIAYPTKIVCPAPPPTPPPSPASNCTQIVNKQLYDLTPLMGWDYHLTRLSDDYSYYISVCGAVQTPACAGLDAVACQVSNAPSVRPLAFLTPINWGPSSAKLGGVTLTYTNGGACGAWGSLITVIFDFECDPSATNMTISTTVANQGCTYIFSFITNVACPQPPPPMTCKQTVDGVLYDLTPLQGKDISIIPSTGLYNYYIDVCGSSQACISQGSAFACQVTKKPVDQFVSILAYSDTAHAPAPEWTTSQFVNGGVTLTFTNGDVCDYHERKTIIDFQCDPFRTGTFSVIESPACVFHVVYPTPYVCVNQPPKPIMPCQQTVNGVKYDLSWLTGVDTAVIPTNGNYNYYINVCGAVQAASCSTKGSAFVCQVRKSPVNQFESVDAYSDGAHTPPAQWSPSLVNPSAGVLLTFTNGDTCNLRTRTTLIDFNCDPTGKGIITVTESPQCTFNINYPTNVVCPTAPQFSSESAPDSNSESSW